MRLPTVVFGLFLFSTAQAAVPHPFDKRQVEKRQASSNALPVSIASTPQCLAQTVTVTVNEPAKIVNMQVTQPAVTVTSILTQMAPAPAPVTITQTVTMAGAPMPAETIMKTVQQKLQATNAGDGDGVTTIPIPKSELPTTTFPSDPVATKKAPSNAQAAKEPAAKKPAAKKPATHSAAQPVASEQGVKAPLKSALTMAPAPSKAQPPPTQMANTMDLGGLSSKLSVAKPAPIETTQPGVTNAVNTQLSSVLNLGNLAGGGGLKARATAAA